MIETCSSEHEHIHIEEAKTLKLKTEQKATRLAWCNRFLYRLRTKFNSQARPLSLPDIIWSDEKVFRRRVAWTSGGGPLERKL